MVPGMAFFLLLEAERKTIPVNKRSEITACTPCLLPKKRSVFRKPPPGETGHFLGGLYRRFGCYLFDLKGCERVEALNPQGRAESVTIKNPIHCPWPGSNAVSYHLTGLLLPGVSAGPQLTGNGSLATPAGYGICRRWNRPCRSISFSCSSLKKKNF